MAAQTTVVVGGGIAGLEAARRCAELGDDVTLLEGSASVGGKLASHVVDGICLDAGAESLLARRPEGLQLVEAAGRSADLVHPATSGAGVWLDRLHPLPRGQLLGIPTDVDDPDLPAVLGAAGVDRLRSEPPLVLSTEPTRDMTVAELVGGQLGADVVDRLVEPLLGGVYAGRADQISVDAALPGLMEAARRTGSVVAAASSLRAGSSGQGSAFASVVGGLGSLPSSLVDARGLTVLTNTRAADAAARRLRRLDRRRRHRRVVSSRSRRCRRSRLLGGTAARARSRRRPRAWQPALSTHRSHWSRRSSMPQTSPHHCRALASWSHRVTGRLTKAATFVTRKWQWVQDAAPGREVFRFSVGRHGDARGLDLPDDELVSAVLDEVRDLLGLTRRSQG